MPRILTDVGHRDLVRAPGTLDGQPVNLLWTSPALGRTEHDHRPAWSFVEPVGARRLLDGSDLAEGSVQRRGELSMNRHGVVAGDDVHRVAVAFQELAQLVVRDSGQDSRARNLVAIEVQDRQDRTVAQRVHELVRMPARGQRSGLGFAVTDDAGNDQAGVVERGSVGVRQGISELAAFVDRSGRFRRDVARDATGEAELPEQPAHSVGVAADPWVHLAVRPLEVRIRHQTRAAMAWPGDVDHVEVALADDPVEVDVQQIESRNRAEMAEQPRLDVVRLQSLAEERVAEEIDLADGQVVRRSPVGVESLELDAVQRTGVRVSSRGRGGRHRSGSCMREAGRVKCGTALRLQPTAGHGTWDARWR